LRQATYFHPYGNAVPQIGTATQVRADLAALGVRYVIVEPQDFHIEGEAVEALLKAIVELPPLATPVFTNDDGRRVIYRLP
jgi:hypothetical protein